MAGEIEFKDGKYETIKVGAALDPVAFKDWWFGWKAYHLGAATGAAVGGSWTAGDGSWARQQHANGALYQVFSPEHQGPFWVDASIDSAYFRPAGGDLSASGGPLGPIGRPLQDTVDFPDGGRVSVFAGGNIYWWADTGARTLSPAMVDVRFDRLHCRVETSGPGSDEPYLLMSVYGPESAWVQMATFDEVDAGGTHRRDMTIYHGVPAGAYIVATLWEQDEGSAEEARDKAGHIVEASTAAIAAAVHVVPGVGGVLAVGVEVVEKLLAKPLAELVSDALGFEDDKIGDARAVLTPKMMIVGATDDQLIGGPRATMAELRFRGDGGDYSAYLVAYPGRTPVALSPAMGNRMRPGQTLSPDARISSDDGRFTLTYQSDGNLVLYRNADGHPLWNSRTDGTSPGVAVMQADGNLVVYDPNVRAMYATGSSDPGSSLVVQDDGNLVIYGPDGGARWASNTVQ